MTRPTRELVIKERLANPRASQKQIGDKVGISQQGVSAILKSAQIPIAPRPKTKYLCNYCGNVIPASVNSRLFCSPKCKMEYSLATVRCDICKKIFKIKYKILKDRVLRGSQHVTCSRTCRNSLRGREHGFRVHPENIALNRVQNKWADFIRKINELLQQGQSQRKISQETGIPQGTISALKRRKLIA